MIDRKCLQMIENVQNELENLVGEHNNHLVKINGISDDSKFRKVYGKYEALQTLKDKDTKFGERVMGSRPATSQFIN